MNALKERENKKNIIYLNLPKCFDRERMGEREKRERERERERDRERDTERRTDRQADRQTEYDKNSKMYAE